MGATERAYSDRFSGAIGEGRISYDELVLRDPEPDASLDAFRGGVAVLTRDGKVEGHVASTVGTFWSPSRLFTRQWWVWFIVVWSNGDREPSFEDYPPDWLTVNDLKAGRFLWNDNDDHHGQYDAECVPHDHREQVLQEMGVSPEDF
ncbi:hypothetical protein AAIB33_07320 [Microbacterium sp. AZCO]|uniref:hypothetical protein n=1 Tax=Microbacterium sp. AZCO TaxID=3142976 RepID=UPI0031F3460D